MTRAWMAAGCTTLVLCAGVVSTGCGSDSPAEEPPPASVSTDGGDLGAGYLVWESNRSGTWRIWRRELAESEPRQLTADEPDRWHCCPHISPDGESIAYLSLPARRKQEYAAEGGVGELRLLAADGSSERRLVETAGTYFENRAVVWRDAGSLIFIGGDGRTRLLDLATGGQTPLTGVPAGKHAWLLNRQLTWATGGRADFAAYDRASGGLAMRVDKGGCQPYFSHDGRWGFWMGGAGGPVDRMDLATGEVSAILRKGDSRLDPELPYVYFPMVSRDGRLFAYAASSGDTQHNHFSSDYEVFVAESDPETLELLGDPVRMTHHPATDRFPDVFLEPLPLGRLRGEAPLTVRFEPPGGGRWRWSLGDGATASGRTVEHTFTAPGSYEIVARGAGRELRGAVKVAAARPPAPLAVRLTDGGAGIAVTFDEEIEIDGVSAVLESGTAVVDRVLTPDARGLELTLAEPLVSGDLLRLAGVTDTSAGRLAMAPTELVVEPPLWPSDARGLLFLWQTGETANLVTDWAAGVERATVLAARGKAKLDHDFAMRLAGGFFDSPEEQSTRVLAGLRRTNEISIEAVLHPAGSGRIVSFASRRQGQNFSLAQEGDRLKLGWRAGTRGREGNPVVNLMRLEGNAPVHVVVTYRPGRLVAYRNGEVVLESDVIRGDFFHWRSRDLRFGADAEGGSDWGGGLEGVALYDRVLSPAEVAENHSRYASLLAERPEVERLVVSARRTASSRVPTLGEISPYRRALVVSEFAVERVVQGEPAGSTLRVAEWAILDGRALDLPAGAVDRRLALESFAANRQLEAVYLSDTLGSKDAPLFYAVD